MRHITMVEKISGSQPSFLTETAICIVERWMKSMGYRLFPSASVQRKVIHAHLFCFFFLSYLQENGEIQNFVTMATLHSVASLLTYLSSWLFNALHLLCVVFLTKSCQTN